MSIAPDTATAALWGDKPPARRVKITRFREFKNQAGTLLGFFSAEMPSGIVIHGLKLMVGPQGTRFVGMPGEKRRGENDQPVLDDRGKLVYDQVVDFRDRATRDRFNEAVLAALRAKYPSLF